MLMEMLEEEKKKPESGKRKRGAAYQRNMKGREGRITIKKM